MTILEGMKNIIAMRQQENELVPERNKQIKIQNKQIEKENDKLKAEGKPLKPFLPLLKVKTIKELHITPETHYTMLKEELTIDNVEGYPLIIDKNAGTGVYVIYEKE